MDISIEEIEAAKSGWGYMQAKFLMAITSGRSKDETYKECSLIQQAFRLDDSAYQEFIDTAISNQCLPGFSETLKMMGLELPEHHNEYDLSLEQIEKMTVEEVALNAMQKFFIKTIPEGITEVKTAFKDLQSKFQMNDDEFDKYIKRCMQNEELYIP